MIKAYKENLDLGQAISVSQALIPIKQMDFKSRREMRDTW